MKFAMTNGDRSIELTESFLLMSRYLDFDIGYRACSFDGSFDHLESLQIHPCSYNSECRLISLSLLSQLSLYHLGSLSVVLLEA